MMIFAGIADYAMPALYGVVLNAICASGAALIGWEGMRFTTDRLTKPLFVAQFMIGLAELFLAATVLVRV